ncbi:heparan sulfate 2-O-sulfotransferase 1-like isoform X2 [Apostichopus japonicus]|uniref:heparan sulfate 2-O-sulfotransferase 1-like isoform X2 n=1 Tax=Stichopus japonicus TaxID=307972 RepID=UPI003AB1864E
MMASNSLRRLRQFLVIFASIATIHQLINLSSSALVRKNRLKTVTNRGQQHDQSKSSENSGSIYIDEKQPIAGNRHVLFNALPKTGSRTLNTVALNIATNHGMRVENTMALENETVRHKIERVLNDTTPTFIYSHLPYYDILQRKPVLLSIVRDPVERLVSLYYFKVYGDSTGPSRYREEMEKMNYTKEPFDACYSKRGICVDKSVLSKNVQQFCGVPPGHPYPSRKKGPKRAKQNIKDNYLFVGTTEDYDGFLQVLEKLLPDMFHGATVFYRNLKRRSYWKLTETLNKTGPSETVKRALRAELHLEYELYDFIKQEFENLKQKLGITA